MSSSRARLFAREIGTSSSFRATAVKKGTDMDVTSASGVDQPIYLASSTASDAFSKPQLPPPSSPSNTESTTATAQISPVKSKHRQLAEFFAKKGDEPLTVSEAASLLQLIRDSTQVNPNAAPKSSDSVNSVLGMSSAPLFTPIDGFGKPTQWAPPSTGLNPSNRPFRRPGSSLGGMVGATAYKKRQAPRMGRFADSKVQADAEELPKVKRLRTTEEGFGAKSPMAHSPAAPSTPLQTPAKPISRTPAVPQSEAQKAILDVLEDMAPPTTSLTMSSPAPAQNPYSKSMARDTASLGEGSATPLRSLFAKKLAEAQEETSSALTHSFGGSLFGKKIADVKDSSFGSPAAPVFGNKQTGTSQEESGTQARKRKERTEDEPKSAPKWGDGFSSRIAEAFGKKKPSENSHTGLNAKSDSSTSMDVKDSKAENILGKVVEKPTAVKPLAAPVFPSFAAPKPTPLPTPAPSFSFTNNAEQNGPIIETDGKDTPSSGLFSFLKKPQSVSHEPNKSQTTAAAGTPRFEPSNSGQTKITPFPSSKPAQTVAAATTPQFGPFKAGQAKPTHFDLSRKVDVPASSKNMDVDDPKTEAFVFVLPVATKTEAFRKSEHYADAIAALSKTPDSGLPVFRFEMPGTSKLSAQTDQLKSNSIASGSSSGFMSSWAADKADMWKCDVCMVRNSQSATKCISCEADRPRPAKSTTPAVTTSSGFASLWATENAEKWKCDACMVRNVKSAAKCISCEAERPASDSSKDTHSSTATAPNPSISSSAPLSTNAFASLWEKQNAGKWECRVCMLRNEQSANKCFSCESEPPGMTGGGQSNFMSSAPKKTTSMAANIIAEAAAALSGGSEKWTCGTCLVKNNAYAKVCVACGVDKP